MPFYEYKCLNCDANTEHFFSIQDSAPEMVLCGSCGKKAPRKFSTFGAVFRGGGWGGSK